MPFMGKDWRSPGEAWVKTESLGWQRMKIIESQLYLIACNHMGDELPETGNVAGIDLKGCDKDEQVLLSKKRSESPATPTKPTAGMRTGLDNKGQQQAASNTSGCCCYCDSSSNQLTGATNGFHRHHVHANTTEPNAVHHHHHHHHQPKTAPHCRISVRTREVAMHNTISEAFYRLDFYNAIHDIRRFNYICKLLHLLITQNLTSLSGCATKVLFTMLEQVAWEVSANKRNINVIRNLLAELKQTIQKYYCWGRPIGSSRLWQQHFETIERISQIVDEIELAPPKNDKCQATFNKLPVEMIREILLRLNDYRDLVNSARASVVMRTMIDNQCVWQKLCRYHFSEQQLKLALESNKFNFVKKQPQNGATSAAQLRGIKYARTVSADGRRTYRSPVASTSETNRQAERRGQQSEQPDNERRATDRQANNSARPNESSSYVTNAVRIFDKERSSSASSSQSAPSRPRQSSQESDESCQQSSSLSSSSSSSSSSSPSPTSPSSNDAANDTSRQALEIDWERVFHQLRKRFDLKEEYADCLLLCRHCRCLFWKSFGHPCIKSDEPIGGASCQCSNLPANSNGRKAAATAANNDDYDCDSCNRSNDRPSATVQPMVAPLGARPEPQHNNNNNGNSGPATPMGARMSVALLSRSFDRRALGGAHDGLANNDENILPGANGDEHTGQPEALAGNASSEQDLDNGARQQRTAAAASAAAASRSAPARRQPLDNLGAQLREHNVNRQRRQDWQLLGQQQQPHNPRRLDAGRDSGARLGDQQRKRGEELVPKHVTISPQAFLKFFSL